MKIEIDSPEWDHKKEKLDLFEKALKETWNAAIDRCNKVCKKEHEQDFEKEKI